MRMLRLARVAFEAEGLRLRQLARARGVQVALGATAAVFALLLLLMLHVAALAALIERDWGPAGAALLVALGDLVVGGGFALAARRASNDPVAEEALRVRQAALSQLGDSAARLVVLAPLLRSQSLKKGAIGAGLTALVVGLMSRR